MRVVNAYAWEVRVEDWHVIVAHKPGDDPWEAAAWVLRRYMSMEASR